MPFPACRQGAAETPTVFYELDATDPENPFTTGAGTFIDTIINVGQDIGLKRGRLVKLDSTLTPIWSTPVGHATFELNELSHLVQTDAGDFLATGAYLPVPLGGSGTALVNWTVKFSSEGEVLWERFDSTIWTPEGGVENDPSGITLLSSGSIVICGTARHIFGSDQFSKGYILKFDKNGCLIEGCELGPLTDIEAPFQANLNVLIYPNPAGQKCTVEVPGQASLMLFDVSGKILQVKSEFRDKTVLDLAALLPGSYFVRIATNDGWTIRKIVK